MDKKIKFSPTATEKFSGSGQWRKITVTGLTDEEKAFIADGGTLVYDSGRPVNGTYGTTLRSVHLHRNGTYYMTVSPVESWPQPQP